ncbi:GNAT family N-acetyltransferase [Marinospirillum perlucidum]|uniref:GNAT family N-acetyltransferase n=1 Tax=Marinospirillum perlucidum TaxID=1982602 RepID=UPI000DF2C592|nr:GNAT family N-acetyltransferase [Marinospirillum perlucidum]
MQHREVREEDLPQLIELPRTPEELFYCFPRAHFPLTVEQLRAGLAKRSDSTLIEKDGQPVAFANFYQWQDGICSIGNFIVAASARGQGVGDYLLRYLVDLAYRKHAAREIRVSCFNNNTRGLLFYSHRGFQPYAIEPRLDFSGEMAALIHFHLSREGS